MRICYHLPLVPAARKIRLALAEKGLDFELKEERVWDRRRDFLKLNPAGEVPVLVEPDGTTLAHGTVISEYLDEAYPEPPLLGGDPVTRAETRRLVVWFDEKFAPEVTDNLVGEKVLKRLAGQGSPETARLRAGLANIGYHLDYIGWLCDRRRWLAGAQLSLADLTAAAHLSCIDYLGDVPWDRHDGAKDWYARIKSRPAFRPLLADRVTGVRAPDHYADLDF